MCVKVVIIMLGVYEHNKKHGTWMWVQQQLAPCKLTNTASDNRPCIIVNERCFSCCSTCFFVMMQQFVECASWHLM